MKISFLTPHLKVRGANRRVIELSNRLISRGHEVTIYHSDGSESNWMECSAEIKPIDKVLNDVHGNLIVTNRKNYPYARKAKADHKFFYVLLLYRGEYNFYKGYDWRVCLPRNKYARWMRALLRNKDFIKIANSSGLQKELKKIGVESELVLGGINTDMFRPVKVKQNNAVLAVGDPLEWKGFVTVKEAFNLVKEKFPQLELHTYYGKDLPQKSLAKAYSQAKVFVDCQEQGGWNNPVAEAMACGTPVVCCEIPSVGDYAIDQETALLVPPNDPRATAKALIRLLKNDGLRAALAKQALKQVKLFDWETTTDMLEEVMKRHG